MCRDKYSFKDISGESILIFKFSLRCQTGLAFGRGHHAKNLRHARAIAWGRMENLPLVPSPNLDMDPWHR
jgi:hypothetical protein